MDEPLDGKGRQRTIISALIILAAIVCIVFIFHSLSRHTLHRLAVQDSHLAHYIQSHKATSAAVFTLVFIAAEALSLPIEAAGCILAGYFFGAVLGILVSIVSATIGASLTFIAVRKFLKNYFHAFMQRKSVARIMRGLSGDPISSILFLRLIPVFPHFVTNVALALSTVRMREYIFATFIGLLPTVTIFVLAGTQFAAIRDTGEVITPENAAVLVLLALFALLPVAWKKLFRRGGIPA